MLSISQGRQAGFAGAQADEPHRLCERERERKFDTCCRPSLEAEVIVRGFQWVNFPWCVKKKLIITLRTSDYFHLLC